METLIKQLLQTTPVITDGAWGTQLQARGLEIGQCPDVWNLTHPDRVEEVARSYVEAGCQIILTNTFGANRIRLGADAREFNLRGAEISRRAAGERAKVFASIGPCGKMLLMGEVDETDLRAAFVEQAQALREGGADALVIETMTDLTEAKLALAAAQETKLPVVVCLVFDTGGRTMMGVTPEQAAQELTAAGADVIGANCGTGISGYVDICRQLRAATTLPIWIKANAGLPDMVDGQAVYRTRPDDFARFVPALREAGASFIGGCCGTTPAHLKTVLNVVHADR